MKHFRYKDSSNSEISSSWETNMTSPNYWHPSNHEIAKVHEMLNDLTQAVLDYGDNKAQYMKVLTRHRTEWPFLWEKIDEIVSYIQEAGTPTDE